MKKNSNKKDKQDLKIYEVVKTYDLEAIPSVVSGEEGWRFRIEILKDCSPEGFYSARVCRREFYNIRPTFSSADENELGESYDHELIILDTAKEWHKIVGETQDKVLKDVLKEIYSIFNIN